MANIIRHKATLITSGKSLTVTVSAAGNDPLSQTYDEETSAYIPDRTLLPLTLVADVAVDGKDATADITSQSWWRIKEDGTSEQITSTTAGHELVAGNPLRLRVKTNTPSGTAAKYIYRVTALGVSSEADIVLRTAINPRPAPELEIDAASAVAWNPFDDESKDIMTITPTVRAHGHTGLSTRWRKIDGTTRRAIDSADPKDIELTVSGTAIKINRRWMGSRVSLVCELIKGGNVIATKGVTVSRRIPDYETQVRSSSIYSDADSKVYAKAEIKVNPGGVVANPDKELLITWYEGTAVVGTGVGHEYNVGGKASVDVGMSVDDRGAWCLAVDADGAYLTDADGAYLLIR